MRFSIPFLVVATLMLAQASPKGKAPYDEEIDDDDSSTDDGNGTVGGSSYNPPGKGSSRVSSYEEKESFDDDGDRDGFVGSFEKEPAIEDALEENGEEDLERQSRHHGCDGCTGVYVSSRGPASKWQSASMGFYKYYKHYNGHNAYYSRKSNRYLYFQSDYHGWMVGPVLGDINCYLFSPNPAYCPTDAHSWKYIHPQQHQMLNDPSLSVACA